MNDNVILSLEGLSAGYGGSNTISNINLSLTAGEALCVVGQSGCGKSTLLKSVMGVFDKPVITGGDIIFDGQRLYELSQKRRCALTTSGMGFIFQTPTSALDAVTRRNVADELIAMRTDCGIAQMIVTHDFALASYVADRIAVMHRGMIVELAPAQELVSSPLHPYTKALLGSVPILGGCIPAFPDVDPEYSGKLIESSPGHFVITEV